MSKEAMTLALEVLKNTRECDAVSHAIKTLEEAIAKQEQRKPVAFITNHRQRMNVEIKPEAFVYMPTTTDWEVPVDTAPQPAQKPWVGLTNEEIATTADYFKDAYGFTQGVLWAEAKLKEKNSV